MPVAEESLANLEKRVMFTSETAPKGRKNAGLSVNEWRNAMQDFTEAELREVLEDPAQPAKKKTAAFEWIKAMGGNLEATRQICDYSNGKPNQKQEIESDATIRVIVEHIDAGNPNQIAETPRLAIAGD